MKGLASLLLVLVVVKHYGYEPIAGLYPDPAFAAKAIFYFLSGVAGAVMFLVVWALTPWKPAQVRLAVSVVCAWGALEEAQTAVCRAAIGFQKYAQAPRYSGLCDVVTGWPVYMLTLLAVLLIFAFQYTTKK